MQDDIFYGIFAINRDRASILKTYILCGISAVERERGRQCLYPADIYCGIFCCVNFKIFCYREEETKPVSQRNLYDILL